MNILDHLRARFRKTTPLPETSRPAHTVDVDAITGTIERALASAGLDTQAGPMKGVTDTIQQALSAAGLDQQHATPGHRESIIEGVAHRVAAEDIVKPQGRTPSRPKPPLDGVGFKSDGASVAPATRTKPALPGEFASRSFTNHAGTRAYKLYIPARYWSDPGAPVPMVVMLHGCTQSPDDFAAGTRMNALAEQHGFLVVYPAQAANANGSKCWNWFRSEDQGRDRGEPSLIAGITREVAAEYRVDARRIFVAGLSAGAAMAVILGATYPELYAAVGAHSGLPYGAAHDMPSAFGAMKGGAVRRRSPLGQGVPTIVFHGDHDRTVDVKNGAAVVEQATVWYSEVSGLHASVEQGAGVGGRTYRRTVYADAANHPLVEDWLLHGAGHAWSGGSQSGSFTDASGPDASAEMVRFFYSQQPAGSA
ncbi:MAG: PHB depolymerase family esterase [Lysobacter sp.]|nr:PHB depolymerase family esterase [Lysobacter sp.]